jgi:hypothetical protein
MKRAFEERRTADFDEWQDRLSILNAAELWQVSNVEKGVFSELKAIYTGPKFEQVNKSVFTRMCVEALRALTYDRWLSFVWPCDDRTPAEAWTPAEPTYSSLFIEVCAEGQEHSREKLVSTRQPSIVGDVLLRSMGETGGHRKMLLAMLTRLMDKVQVRTPSDIFEWPQTLRGHIVSGLRGFAVFVILSPLLYGGGEAHRSSGTCPRPA